MKCQVLVDWLTFSVKENEPGKVIRDYLGLDPELFQDTGSGLLGYNKVLRFSDICVCYEARENAFFKDMRVCVSMSGNGCRTFEAMSQLAHTNTADKQHIPPKNGWMIFSYSTFAARIQESVAYCHPYSAYERGSNENGNRMIWRRVPKGTDFTGITEADTLAVQRWVNEYLRGILGGRCAGRVLLELAQGARIEGVELLLKIMHKKQFWFFLHLTPDIFRILMWLGRTGLPCDKMTRFHPGETINIISMWISTITNAGRASTGICYGEN